MALKSLPHKTVCNSFVPRVSLNNLAFVENRNKTIEVDEIPCHRIDFKRIFQADKDSSEALWKAVSVVQNLRKRVLFNSDSLDTHFKFEKTSKMSSENLSRLQGAFGREPPKNFFRTYLEQMTPWGTGNLSGYIGTEGF